MKIKTNTISGNKRIAINTIIINVRLIVTMIVGLFTSRYVLQVLGASDFGLYSVIAGALTMITFVASSMSSTTTRYINYEMGKPEGNMNWIFNVCMIIHIVMAILIFLAAETVGIYYILNYLNVEPGRENDAMFVFQISTITACVGIVNAPYQGLLVANENFATIAKVEIANSLLKLLLVLSLFLLKNNILRVYALYMSVMTAVSFIAYHYICYKNWHNITKWSIKGSMGSFKEILTFNNYNLLGACAMMLREQGVNMIINFFFGTVVNAAFAIARTVQSYVNTFMANFDSAAGPQIIQSLSSGDSTRTEFLTIKVGKMCILLAMIAVFPLAVDIDFILTLWLGDVPENTNLFCLLTLLLVLVGSTSAGLTQVINGSGKIKWFKIEVSILYTISIPICFFLYKQGAHPVWAVVVFIIADILSRIIQLTLLYHIVGFNSIEYIRKAYARPFAIMLIMFALMTIMHIGMIPSTIITSICVIIITLIVIILLSFFVGLNKRERYLLASFLLKKLHK